MRTAELGKIEKSEIRIRVRLQKKMADELKSLSEEQHISVSHLVSNIISDFFMEKLLHRRGVK